jgi:hypothetical protein
MLMKAERLVVFGVLELAVGVLWERKRWKGVVRKEMRDGMKSGAEKKAKKGQMYSICARWMVAMWLDLSPISGKQGCRS